MNAFVLTALLFLAVVGTGASLAFQQVINAGLRGALGSPWWAAFASYAFGAGVTAILALAIPGPRPGLASLARVPPLLWSGGLFGAIFVVGAILAVPRLGAAAVLALVVLGQMFAALLFDAIGLMGLPQQAIGPTRILGAALLVAGAVLVRR